MDPKPEPVDTRTKEERMAEMDRKVDAYIQHAIKDLGVDPNRTKTKAEQEADDNAFLVGFK